MAVGNVVTRGYGSWSTFDTLVVRGYGIGSADSGGYGLPGGSGHEGGDYFANQRKTREILKIKRKWAKVAVQVHVEKVASLEAKQVAQATANEAMASAAAMLSTIEKLARQQAKTVHPDKYERFEKRRLALLQQRQEALEVARDEEERVRKIAAEIEAREAFEALQEQEAVETMMVLMLADNLQEVRRKVH
jgi:hypothetical protein